MNKTLLALAVLASAAAAPAYAGSPVCVSFAPAGFCDSMQFDSKKKATWENYDCAGSMGKQTTASYKKKATTTCDGAKGCNPSAYYGWDSLDWTFNLSNNTGTLTGVIAGTTYTLQQNMPISVTEGACSGSKVQGGVSSLAR